jgi:hypothetical protein
MFLCRERPTRASPFREWAGLSCPIFSWAFLQCVLFFLAAFIVLQPVDARADGISWWNLSYGYRQQLTVTNNTASVLPSGYSVCLSLDHFSLVQAGKSSANGNDVRIVYWDGSTNVELDRVAESRWNSVGTRTQIWFRTQADLAESGTDNNYFVYYGNTGATSPPANRKNIYEFFDDFSDYEARQYDTSIPDSTDIIRNGDQQVWKIRSGIWNIETDTQADGTTGKVLSHDSVSGFYAYAYALNRNYDNVLVQVKMRTKNGENGGYWPFGARLDTSTGANYCAWSYFDFTKMLKFSDWNSYSILDAGTTRSGMGNTWHTFQFTLDGKRLNLYFDGVSYGCYVEDTTLTSGTIFAMGSSNRKIHFDDFEVRKYTTNEPSVSGALEEMTSGRPTVSLDKKWHLKGDGYIPADRYLGVGVSFPEADGMPEAQASYEIPEGDLNGPLSRTTPTSWEGQVDISNLPTGTFHIVVTVADTAQQWISDARVFYVSHAFYHVWSIDWEGEYVQRVPYLDNLAALADEHGMPVSQLFNPRVYVHPGMPEWQKAEMTQWLLQRAQTKGDEIGLHLHMYFDYVQSAGLTPITSPHWGNQSDGYDVPFSNYDYEQSLTLLNFAIELFQQRGLGRPSSFRAGGWFADEDNLTALSDLEFLDSSGGILRGLGSLPSPWDLSVTSQPYHPCGQNQNTSNCSSGDENLQLIEIPNNIGPTNGSDDLRPNFDSNYSGAPLDSVRVGVLLSHDASVNGAERTALEQYFAHADSFLYVADRGAVIYATLADVRKALSQSIPDAPDAPDSLGPPELVSGGLVEQGDETFAFRLHDRDSLDTVKYRIMISRTPDYGYQTGLVIDYVSRLGAQGIFRFTVGQSESTGSYSLGFEGQTLSPGSYYWKVKAINSQSEWSGWSQANNGDIAFTLSTGETGVEKEPEGSLPLSISFPNPSSSTVLMRVTRPAVGDATILNILDYSGRLIRQFRWNSGATTLYWDGRDSEGKQVASGVYLLELEQRSQRIVRKLVILR